MMLALYAAFWLQLESASSAAVCVGILALPTRGQALQKAFFRFLATAIGVAASIVISGLFNELREVFIVACAGWLGLCVFAAGMFDGNRAYGAVLSGYTVAIVAIANIDAPQAVFLTGINRGAAIAIGILALAVVNDVFAAPDVLPDLFGKLTEAHRKVRRFAQDAFRREEANATEVALLFREITALHSDITALSAESIGGRALASAARSAAISLLGEVRAARAVAATLASSASWPQLRDDLVTALDDASGSRSQTLRSRLCGELDADHTPLVAACAALVLLEQECATTEALYAIQRGRGYGRVARLPIYRSWHAAARSGLRVFLAVVIASEGLLLTGWPMTSFTLMLLGATAGLSATNPNPRGFASGALVAMPLAAAMAGVTEFLVLDGVDQFPLLALAMAPPVIVASLLMADGSSKLYGIGFLVLVFFPVLLSPSNPQSYDPQIYVFTSTLAVTAVVILFVVLSTLLPTTDAQRRRWMLRSFRRELRSVLDGRLERTIPPAAAFRDADRIGQLLTFMDGTSASREADLRRAVVLAELAAASRQALADLDHDQSLRRDAAVLEARAALAAVDPVRLRRSAKHVLDLGRARSELHSIRAAAVQLVWAATLIESNSTVAESVRQEPAR